MTNYQKILSDLDATCGCTHAAEAAAVAIRELLAEREALKAARKPLTDDQIFGVLRSMKKSQYTMIDFARAVEIEAASIGPLPSPEKPPAPKQEFCPGDLPKCKWVPDGTGSKCETCGDSIPF